MPLLPDLLEALAQGVESGPDAMRVPWEKDPTIARQPSERITYLGRPVEYAREILGVELTPQQEQVLKLVILGKSKRYLLKAGNNLGKTFVLGCALLYAWDVLSAVREANGKERGAMIILTGPSADTVRDTLYRQVLELRQAATMRGYAIPGKWSGEGDSRRGQDTGISVSAKVGPRWFLTAITPSKRVGRGAAHQASGRHHPNLWVFMCEAAGIDEAVWAAMESMATGSENAVVCDFNPTEPTGPVFRRAQLPTWTVFEMSALDHPNVRERRDVVGGGAISYRAIENRIRAECVLVGPYPAHRPDTDAAEFVYALPGADWPEAGKRIDAFPGHPGAPLMVWRPTGLFVPQVLGRFPLESSDGLFDMEAVNRAVARWRARPRPVGSPDAIGLDVARGGDDEAIAFPRWGRPAPDLMRAWRDALVEPELEEDRPASPVDLWAQVMAMPLEGTVAGEPVDRVATRRALLATGRVYLGECLAFGGAQTRDGITLIENVYAGLTRAGVGSPAAWIVDGGGIGAGALDTLSLRGVHRREVQFGGSPLPVLPDETLSENMRTQITMRFAWLVRHDLVDLPPDSLLIEEMRAAKIFYGERTTADDGVREDTGRKRTRTVARLMAKVDFKSILGRSPDRLDAAALALMPAVVAEVR